MALTKEQLKQVLESAPKDTDHRAVAKLTKVQRMEAYALVKLGFTHSIVAQLFAIHRATIGHMVRPSSRHYVDVRAEYDAMGHEDFVERYLSIDTFDRAKGLRTKIEQQPDSAESLVDKRNPKADKRAGEHNYRGVTFKILWHDRGNDRTTGWIAALPDDYANPMPYGYELVFATSTQCYQETCRNIDKDGMIY